MSSESSHGLVHRRRPFTVSEPVARLEGIVRLERADAPLANRS
jgi:hypothetical protein